MEGSRPRLFSNSEANRQPYRIYRSNAQKRPESVMDALNVLGTPENLFTPAVHIVIVTYCRVNSGIQALIIRC